MNSIADNLTSAGEYITDVGEQFRKIPGVFSYYKNGEEQDIDSIPVLNDDNFKFYVGQTLKFRENQFYSEDFYIGAISNLLENVSKDSIINIEVGSDLKQILDSDGENSDIRMSSKEQVEYINYIINKYFKKEKNRIKVNNISDSHSELFNSIETNGVPAVLNNCKLSTDDLNSLDIYNLLFEATILDSKFFANIQKTRPSKVKEINTENSKYYPLVEIAFRLTDYINGVYIQGGERRQNMYDVIIRDILSGGYNHIDAIKQIYDLVQSKYSDDDFESLHFNKKKYEKEHSRQEGLKKMKNYIGGVSLAVTLTISAIGGTILYKKNQEEQVLQKKIDRAIIELSAKMPEFRDFTDNFMRMEGGLVYEPLSFSKHYSEELAKRFVSIYGEGDEDGYQFIQLLILETMKNSDEFFKKQYYLMPSYWYNDFLRDEFIENNKTILLLKGYSIDKELGDFSDYIDIMKDTAKLTDEEMEDIKFGTDIDIYESPFIDTLIHDKKFYTGYYNEIIFGYIVCHETKVVITSGLSLHTKCLSEDKDKKLLVALNIGTGKYSLKLGRKVSKELLDLL